ncbi:MAG TPA: CHAD domain-containing protein [Steroidobacteraceae bacterium]|nr:CHAD domain-containing protein [Steroidobacteraceae bacterium]
MTLSPRHPGPESASGAGAAGPGCADAREVEWQLAAPDLGVIQRWLDRHSAADTWTIEPLPPQQLHDTYLDTEDWRLFRAGFALRVRERGGRVEATLKGLRSARDDLADRREITEQLPGSGPRVLEHAQGPVGSRVRDIAGVKPLRTLFQVRTSRQRYAVRSRKPAADLGEIALDEARFTRSDGHRRPMILTRVELEAAGSDAGPLEQLAQRLRTECELHPASENKFVVGLRSASLEPPRLGDVGRKAAPVQPQIDASTGAADFAFTALRRLADEWQAHEPSARLGESAEALHALRVTARRLDTVLSLFDAYLPVALVRNRPRLKGLLDAMGAVRDVDVRLAAAAKFRDGLPEADRGTFEPLLAQLASERQAARSAMLHALDAKPARHWLDTLPEQLAPAAPGRRPASSRQATALAAVPDLIRKRYRKLRKCARKLNPQSSLREHHKVRIRAKKLRYALEIVAPTYGKAASDMLAKLHKLQNKLGDQHDAGAIAQYLRQLATRPPACFGPGTLFNMGRMAESNAREAGRLGGKVGKPWRKVRRKGWRALHSHMRALRGEAPATIHRPNGSDRHAQAHGGSPGRSPGVPGPRAHPHARES